MAASDVDRYHKSGLTRNDEHFQRLEALLDQPEYKTFARLTMFWAQE